MAEQEPPTISYTHQAEAPSTLTARKLCGTPKPITGIILAACSWTAVLLLINRALFRLRLIETGDLATILYQVRDAKRFHELLGNYSRWGFHHPGPGFMYVLALGLYINFFAPMGVVVRGPRRVPARRRFE